MEFTRKNKKVKWAELLPDEFLERQQQNPVVYLPMGLCEPHGHIAAFGLDTIKAEFICEAAANRVGGIVAPTQGYHIHETGYHAPWLEEVLGEANPYMAAVPPDILLHLFLYQLRSFYNSGFKNVVVITGHAGGNQEDLRLVAYSFMEKYPITIEVRADPELVEKKFEGDHAGKFEISQLMYIRPDLIDMSKISRRYEDRKLGRFALGDDAAEASTSLGKEIINACIDEVCRIVEKQKTPEAKEAVDNFLTFRQMEDLWEQILSNRKQWATWNLHPGQQPTSAGSKWKVQERPG